MAILKQNQQFFFYAQISWTFLLNHYWLASLDIVYLNTENLVPNNKRSPNEVRENGKKGGIASGKARRKKAD